MKWPSAGAFSGDAGGHALCRSVCCRAGYDCGNCRMFGVQRHCAMMSGNEGTAIYAATCLGDVVIFLKKNNNNKRQTKPGATTVWRQ